MHSMPQAEEPRRDKWRTAPAAQVLSLALYSLTVVSLAGCVSLDSSTPRVMSQKTALSAEDSFVSMPAGGPAVVGVIERKFKDAVVRETVLATDARVAGENMITVSLYGPINYATPDDNALGEDSIEPEQIAKELGWYLTDVPMRRSSLYAQNKYGPFGFATGMATTGDRCLYAWQKIHRQHSPFAGQGTIGIRLRLCDAYAGFEQLLSVMYGYTITGYLATAAWDPYGSPAPVAADLGALSAPKYPFGRLGETAQPPVPRRQARVPSVEPAETMPEVIVPEPSGSKGEAYPVVPGPTP
jgi:Cellulose biosynthesis protein BcsN